MKTKAFRMYKYGGPEVMKLQSVDVPDPGPGQVMLRHKAIGLNMADIYRRRGLYKIPLPSGVGIEGAGIVEAVGPGVRGIKVGDRAGYASGMAVDAYAQVRLAPADRLIPLPDSISDRTAAAMLLKGITAQYLIRRTYRVKAGDTILVHAAAGGVGTIMCQWANAIGATVIGVVSTQDKARFAKRHGCHHPIVTRKSKYRDQVMDITGGEGVHCVYDSVGRDTWDESLACVRRLGTMASFGSASGEPAKISVASLGAGSPHIVRAGMASYMVTRRELISSARDLFAAVDSGAVKIRINQRYALKDARKAQRDMEARRTTGSTVLIP